MDQIVVGEQDCSYNRLVNIFLAESTGGIVASKWEQLARTLEIKDVIIVELRKKFMLETMQTADILYAIFRQWRMMNGEAATLSKLAIHSRNLGWNSITEAIAQEFCPTDMDIDSAPKFKDTLPGNVPFHVERRLLPRYTISKEIFKSVGEDIIVVYGLKHDQVGILARGRIFDSSRNQVHRFEITVSLIILENSYDWQRLRSKSNRPIHLILCNWRNDEFTWIDSKGNVSLLQQFIILNEELLSVESFINELEFKCHFLKFNQAVCISDSPGMGKSILLANIGRHLQCLRGDRIVIFVAFSEWIVGVHRLNEAGMDIDIAVINSLLKMACENQASSKLTSLFETDTEGATKLEILIDAFDEMHSDYIQFAYDCLRQILIYNKSIRLWVSTRPHMYKELEDTLCTISYNIRPLDGSDQAQFLKRFWSQFQSNKQLSEEKLLEFANECLEKVKSDMKSKDGDVAAVPLQCMLIGELFQEEAVGYSERGSDAYLDICTKSVSDLYERFIVNKITKFTLKFSESEIKHTDLEIKLAHAILALQLIFPGLKWVLKFCIGEEVVSRKNVFNVGIVENSDAGGFKFIHVTFAEYFIAWFVVDFLFLKWCDELTVFLMEHVLENSQVQITFLTHGKERSIPSREFKHSITCYFIDSIIERRRTKSYNNLKIFFNKNRPQSIKYAIEACLHSDLTFLFKFLREVVTLQTHLASYFDPNHIHVAVSRASLDLIVFYTSTFSSCISVEASFVHSTILHMSVVRGNYCIFNYILNYLDFANIIDNEKKLLVELLLDCVSWTSYKKNSEIEQRLEILKALIRTIPGNLKNIHIPERSYPQSAGISFLIELVKCRKFLFEVKWIIHVLCNLSDDRKEITSKNVYTLLKSFPYRSMVKLVEHHKDEIHDLLCFLSLSMDSLKLLKTCKANFSALNEEGLSVLQGSVKYNRSNKNDMTVMWQNFIDLGVDYKTQTKYGNVLHFAAYIGNTTAAAFFLRKEGMHVNMKNMNGETPLDCTIQSDKNGAERFEVASFLISRGGVRTTHKNSSIILQDAVLNRNIFSLQIIHELFGVDLNIRGDNGMTPLHRIFDMYMLLDGSRLQVTEFLLFNGGSINATNDDGETPVEYALRHKPSNICIQIYNLFASRGSTLTETAGLPMLLWIATWRPSSNYSVNLSEDDFDAIQDNPLTAPKLLESNAGSYLQFLLDYFEFDVNAKYRNGETLLHIAMRASGGCFSETINVLLDNGGDVNLPNNIGSSPLKIGWKMEADLSDKLLERRLDLVKKCLPKMGKIDVFTLLQNDMFSKYRACTPSGFHIFVKFLIDINKVNALEVADQKGRTPLMMAVKRLELHLETVVLLRENEVQFNIRDKRGYSILHYALKTWFTKSVALLKILRESGATCNCRSQLATSEDGSSTCRIPKIFECVLHVAASMSANLSVFRFLVDEMKSCCVNTVDINGDVPLHRHCRGQYTEDVYKILILLVKHGADVNIRNNAGNTPLHCAIMSGQPVRLLKVLVKFKAEWKMLDKRFSSCLHLAATYCHPDGLRFFLDLGGINVNGADMDGNTPLHSALLTKTKLKRFDVIEILLKENADVNLKNKNGETPLDILRLGKFSMSIMQLFADFEVVNPHPVRMLPPPD